MKTLDLERAKMADPQSDSIAADLTIPTTELTAAPSPAPPQPSASDSDPALARTVSFSKLNAKAPEFVPSPKGGDPRILITPQQTLPAGMIHGYGAPNTPFAVGVQGQVPVQNHHFLPIHHHQHQQQQHHVQYQHHHHHQHHRNQQNQQHQHHTHKQKHVLHGVEQEGVAKGQKVQNDRDQLNDRAAELRNGLSKDACDKIINQVEYYFSDVNLATTDHLIKFINKDPEGYVPISVVASFKKIKAAISSNSQLAAVLRNSKKLVVSDDGKKVKRLQCLTGSDMEELQARIILAENLPEDYSHQNLMKIFSAVGSVKSIRTCQPQASNNAGSATSRTSKTENMLYSNKVHAFVEYDSIELAEKAVAELNDECDWRNGLRVRMLHKHTSISVQERGKKVGNGGEGTCEEDGSIMLVQDQSEKQAGVSSGHSDIHCNENVGEEHGGEKGGQKKGRNRGRGKGRGRGHQHQASHAGGHVGTLTSTPANTKPVTNIDKTHHPPPGPRMPDGTRGFSLGRGKPLVVNTA